MRTVKIPLTQGQVAIIDAVDYPLISQFKWSAQKDKNTYYAVATYRGIKPQKTVMMHRLLLGLVDRREEGDHKNGNGLDNRRTNLRRCTHSQNGKNMRRKRKKPGTSLYKGVFFRWFSGLNPWIARICVDGKHKHLGCFGSEKAAAMAYDDAARKHHKEFACLNFPSHQVA